MDSSLQAKRFLQAGDRVDFSKARKQITSRQSNHIMRRDQPENGSQMVLHHVQIFTNAHHNDRKKGLVTKFWWAGVAFLLLAESGDWGTHPKIKGIRMIWIIVPTISAGSTEICRLVKASEAGTQGA